MGAYWRAALGRDIITIDTSEKRENDAFVKRDALIIQVNRIGVSGETSDHSGTINFLVIEVPRLRSGGSRDIKLSARDNVLFCHRSSCAITAVAWFFCSTSRQRRINMYRIHAPFRSFSYGKWCKRNFPAVQLFINPRSYSFQRNSFIRKCIINIVLFFHSLFSPFSLLIEAKLFFFISFKVLHDFSYQLDSFDTQLELLFNI